MNFRKVLALTGRMLIANGMLMIAPLCVSIIYKDGQILPFVYSILISFALGACGYAAKPKNSEIYAREGMIIVALTWVLFSVVGGLPFWFSKQIPSLVDCIFETASGFTTTGSTILTDVEAMSKSLLFWRSFTHWIGGMGVLVFVTAIISDKNSRTTHVMRAEMPGPKIGKLAAKWQFSIRILYAIYITLTIIEILLLLLGGMNIYDSLVHTFGTAGTGGFGIKNTSIGYYDSAYIDYVIGIFMLLFGVNFNIYYLILVKQFFHVKNNSELKLYLSIVAGASILIMMNITYIYGSPLKAFRYSFFQVSSIITTTGYATTDFCKWPMFSQMILLALMFVGGCAGSTGGGLKVIRISIMLKCTLNEVKRAVSPRSVLTVKNDGKPLESQVVQGVSMYLVVYAVIMVVSVLIVALDNFDMATTITSVITTLNNIGPGLASVGPAGNFSEFSVLSKLVLTFDMLAGRLELFPMLVLFTPLAWKKI
ncbi:MAG: TrkH family potassium uptake protein [bacterium]|nr:TrkH family potassium uptake protein [bacterium]